MDLDQTETWHDALKAHMQQVNKNHNGTIVEMDISQYTVLEEILAKKITDKRFLAFGSWMR